MSYIFNKDLIMKFFLQLLSLFLVSNVLFAEEKLTLDSIDVFSSTPLPSIGLPKNMVPSNIQTVRSSELEAQSGV